MENKRTVSGLSLEPISNTSEPIYEWRQAMAPVLRASFHNAGDASTAVPLAEWDGTAADIAPINNEAAQRALQAALLFAKQRRMRVEIRLVRAA
jgi:hypothetical protein